MPTAINIKNMSKQDWLLERTNGIGGSDASVVLGINKYKSAFELWHEKTGQSPLKEIDNDAIHFGNILEDVVAKEFERRTGHRVRKDNHMYSHSDYPFMKANLDRVVVGEKALLECKTANARLQDAWKDDDIPSAYFLQVQHYLAVMGYPKAYIAVLIGGQKFIWKEIKRDEELIALLIEHEKTFWEENVLKKVAPTIDGSEAARLYLGEQFASTNGETKVLKKETTNAVLYRAELKQTIKQLQQEMTMTENKLKLALGHAAIGVTDRYEVKWQPIETRRIDTKRLKIEEPSIYKLFLKTSQSRRLTIKELS